MTDKTNAGNPAKVDGCDLATAGEKASSREYAAVLETCSQNGGATIAQVKDAFGKLVPQGEEAVLPQRFINDLKNRGALVWTEGKTWATSDYGKCLLCELKADEKGMVVSQMRVRADVYGLLARFFRVEADQELLDLLGSASQETGTDQMSRGLCAMKAWVGAPGADPLKALAIDYVKAFIGTGIDGHEAAYPFESAYVSENHLLMQASRDEVLAIYLSEDLGRVPSWTVGEDHVALELEFMQTMARRTAEALEAGNEPEADRLLDVQRNFLHDHLGAWAPAFARDTRLFARTDFYRGAADMLEGFMEADIEYLG